MLSLHAWLPAERFLLNAYFLWSTQAVAKELPRSRAFFPRGGYRPLDLGMLSLSQLKRVAKSAIARTLGYDQRNWLRIRQIEAFANFLKERPTADVLEISPGWNDMWKNSVTSYTSLDYPEFDICADTLPRQFDIIILDQVLEHVPRPESALRNVLRMLCPGGHAMIATPFLFRIHGRPHDYTRWTEAGLTQVLIAAGFEESGIRTYSWGNKACARAHIGGPIKAFGVYRPMQNEPEYPLMVWAFAKKF